MTLNAIIEVISNINFIRSLMMSPYMHKSMEINKISSSKVGTYQKLFSVCFPKSRMSKDHTYNFWGIPHLRAEDEGFEPSVGHPTHAFQACALGRYANPPVLLEG